MRVLIPLSLFAVAVSGQNSDLEGTWSSKSNQVFTGPGFYDPIEELLIEPALPGISYSFTADGYFEEAMYQVSGNPQDPKCPVAVLIFQHGTYEVKDDGQLVLTPIEVDGRQLLSQPCDDEGVSTYSRYYQAESFKSYLVQLDTYYGKQSLQLYGSDGAPLQPLFLAYKPPVMLPTITLNPTASDDAQPTSNAKRDLISHVRRSIENRHKTNAVKKTAPNIEKYWWGSLALIGVGSIAFLLS
ncbi:Rot1p [Kluyveromyces lactis]|uniref:Protein ROT1 n=1 Tax=Kluyveromyces lactis (strain ATCC 8585 / CBS 2359 / DSM 70799 / NBRC 1267 / NRRL Y-1140 / WM37) TaxID=284590 RepID=ROT1_KLULA|nr:uncharacterized protein KLLA0_F06468g [Kluyveromyces lactis]Q6CL16.1 RecName: Full=Protein ROT1; Flags: Precursor [Kluyveromyces lactis NRRL Y-1140]CAG98081.1 KLLA0F06468p [Kluyveromyces lactis]|eukprot:XP_455373.1 uncharacterized protein KLLA0_F06468g [Kluyveromyces lactis]